MLLDPAFNIVTAPGLPTFPRLYFDAQQRRAYVEAKLATWRSWKTANQVVRLVRWCLNGLAGWWTWHQLAFIDEPVARMFLTSWAFLIVVVISRPVMHLAFEGFLARQVFAARNRFWFTPQAISFQSRLYDHAVKIARTWKDQSVACRFDVTEDLDAAIASSGFDDVVKSVKSRLQSAYLLRLVVATFDPLRSVHEGQKANMLRSIPVLEVDLRDAQGLTVVLAAATSLTASKLEPNRRQTGVDIDVVQSEQNSRTRD